MKSAKILYLLGMLIVLAVSPVSGESLPAGEYPGYQTVIQTGIQTGILTIPCVDTPEQPCMFQDAKFQLTEKGGWSLTDYKVSGQSPFTSPFAYNVEIIVTETFPVQVFLKVKVFFPYKGPKIGRIPQRLKDNRFEVVMYAVGTAGLPLVEYFEEIIPLSVYGLSAGTYEYSLSGLRVFAKPDIGSYLKTFTGTFVLTRDNKF
ncbi:MAG: hypothetical protein HQK72_00125 [Desulfamplus sp.]|nr:hypothetical protein [Desulfamplus sp.]